MSEKACDDKNAAKSNQTLVRMKAFYNKHFPTDRISYNLRIPFVGLILSILSLHFVTLFVMKIFFQRTSSTIIEYCYIFAAAGVGYQLYYGLKNGDRTQYTPWILLKLIEICLSIVAIIYGCFDNSRYLSYVANDMIYGSVVLVLNVVVAYVVVSKSVKQNRLLSAEKNFDPCDDI